MQALGASLVAISPQTPDHSLSAAEKLELTFAVLSDLGNEVAREFGLVFSIDETVQGAHRNVGANLPAFNGDDSWELPMTGIFVIDRSGVVRLAFVVGDFTRRLDPGVIVGRLEEVEPEIERRLNAAEAILLLVSADYLDSLKRGNIEKEIAWAVERHEAGKARVIPIILRHCPWEDAPFAKLQVLPTSKTPISVFTGAKRDQIYKEVAKGIREAIMEWVTS